MLIAIAFENQLLFYLSRHIIELFTPHELQPISALHQALNAHPEQLIALVSATVQHSHIGFDANARLDADGENSGTRGVEKSLVEIR